MDDVTIFCSDLLPVHRLMSICDQFKLVLGAKEHITKVKQNLVLWEHRSLSIVGKNLVIRCEGVLIGRSCYQEKDMEDSEICVEHANMPGHFEIKKEVALGLLKGIKVDKSLGPVISTPGEVLEDWQVANVVPLFKKGNRDNPGNYRP
eukprot:g27995.t1